ncbi:MAG: hypothetical protein VKJ46_05270 [Leptolyngbyaceae bacterium]|nr:hypothetical protein [Leptolyngbyaceae bacterium]
MLKSIYLLGLASAVALGFTSLPAHADQISEQVNNQSAAAVGEGNYIHQESNQRTLQQHIRRQTRKSGDFGAHQEAYVYSDQTAGAVGYDNLIEQKNEQETKQQNIQRPSRRLRRY